MGADPVISAEDEEQRLRQRLKQRQMERKKTATEVSTLDHNRVEKVNSVDKTTEISVKDSGTSSSSKNLESAPPSDSPSKRNTGKNIPEGIKSTGTKPSDDKKSELEIEEKGATNGKCEGSRRPRSPDKNVSAKMADSSDGKHEGSRRSRSPDKNASTKAADNTNGKREGSRRSRSPDKNDSTKTADSTKGKREGSRRSRSPDKNASVKTADSTNGKREGRRRSRSPEKNVSTKSADSTKGKREGSKRSRSPDKNGSVKGADSNDDKKGDELTPKRRRRRRRRGGRRRRDRRRMREMERDWHRGDNRDGFGPPGPMRGGFPPGRRGDIPPPGYGRPPDFRGGFPRDFNDRGPPNDRMSEEEFRRRREFERRERERWERNFPGRDRQRDESERFRDRDRDRMRDRDRDRDKNRDRDRDRSRDRDKVDKDRDRSRGRGKDSSRRRSLSCSRSDSGSSSGSDSRSRSGSRSSSRGRRKSSSGKKDDASTDKKAGTESIEIKNVLEVDEGDKALDGALTKDQRTVFVSQLVMRADEGDIRGFFERKARCRVNDVILLRDRRTGRHKGCAYVELGRLSDVQRAVTTDSTVPDFQRFPILVRASEAEKNYEAALGNAVLMGTAAAGFGAAGSDLSNIAALAGGLTTSAMLNLSVPGIASNKKSEAQNVYVGSIDRCVTQAQLYALFSQFGVLDKVALQMDTTTGMSRGFAFLSYRDSRDANLAIQTMSGQKLAGRALDLLWSTWSRISMIAIPCEYNCLL